MACRRTPACPDRPPSPRRGSRTCGSPRSATTCRNRGSTVVTLTPGWPIIVGHLFFFVSTHQDELPSWLAGDSEVYPAPPKRLIIQNVERESDCPHHG